MARRRSSLQIAGGIAILGAIVYGVIRIPLEVRHLKQMCNTIPSGSSVADLHRIISAYGFSSFHGDGQGDSNFDARDGLWTIYVPAPSTLGEFACKIQHNGNVVTAAVLDGPANQ